jgi:hypothetical protein
MSARVLVEISLIDVLKIADEVDEPGRVLVEHAQEAGRPTSELNAGLSLRVRGREENAGLSLALGLQVRRDRRLQPACVLLVHPGQGRLPMKTRCFIDFAALRLRERL